MSNKMETAIMMKDREDFFEKCSRFADESLPTNKDEYEKRSQYNIDKIKEDIKNGKLAEFCVYHILSQIKASTDDLPLPDLTIYPASKKSFQPDLVLTRKTGKIINFHIKTQTIESGNMFGVSWSFQKYDPVVTRPTDSDYFIGTTLDLNNNICTIKLKRPFDKLKFGPPRKENLTSKTCIYLQDNQ